MRIQKQFGERTRTHETDQTKRKFFLLYEGEVTEERYFAGINGNKATLGINQIIEIHPILRSFSEKGWSNPKKLLDRLVACMTESEQDQISYRTLIDRTVEYLAEDETIGCDSLYNAKDILNNLKKEYESQSIVLDTIIEDTREAAQEIIELLKKKMEIPVVIDDLDTYIKEQRLLIDKEIDFICLLVDRDKKSFFCTERGDQYQYVLETCKEHSIHFYIKNPCFEFWLLMHFDEVDTIDKKMMLENPKISNPYNYAQKQLKKVLLRYTKTNIKFDVLCPRTNKAIQNEKEFCEDINSLEHELGSNIGLLISEMKQCS